MRNSGGLKTGLSPNAWKVWGLKTISKQCGSAFAEIRYGNRRSCPKSWTYRRNQCRASSGTINTRERTSAQRDTSLLMLWRRSDGQGVPSIGTSRTGTKTPSSRTRKSSPSRSSTTTRTTRFILKQPVRWRKTFRGRRESITLLPLSLVGVVPSRGDTSSSLQDRGEVGVRVYQADMLQEVV